MSETIRRAVRRLALAFNILYCHRCGNGNPPGTRFCGECGALLQ